MSRELRLLTLTLVGFATLCLGGADRSAAQPALSNVSVMVGGYEVFARTTPGAEPALTAHAVLTGPDGLVKARAFGRPTTDGSLDLAFAIGGPPRRRPVLLAPGDSVHVTVSGGDSPGGAVVLPVPTLGAAADPDTDQVTGSAPPGTEVSVTAVTVGGTITAATAAADAGGRWQVDLSGDIDVAPGTRGMALFRDGDVIYQAAWVVHAFSAGVGSAEMAVTARPGETVRAVLTAADGAYRGADRRVSWADEARLWLRDAGGDLVPVAPGDRITLTLAPEGSTELVVPPLDVTIDPDADRVSGTTVPDGTVAVSVDGSAHSATADASGGWRLELAGHVDITTATPVTVASTEDPWAPLTAYAAGVPSVDPLLASVQVQGAAGTPAALTLAAVGGAQRGSARGRVGADGKATLTVFGALGEPLPLERGDTLAVQLADAEHVFEVAPLEVAANAGRDTVEGRSVPGAEVVVETGGTAVTTQADADGRWHASLDGSGDLRPGTEVRVGVIGADGYSTALTFPVFRVNAQVGGATLRVEGPPGLRIAAEVEREGAVVGTAECAVPMAGVERAGCIAAVRTDSGTPLILARGDAVLAFPDDGSTASLVLEPLTAHIDLSGKDVTGEAPPSDEVRIEFAHQDGAPTPLGAVAGTDIAGVYDHELMGGEQDLLLPGLLADVRYTLPNDHRQFARGVVERVRISPGSPEITGLAEPRSLVTATLRAADGRAVVSAGAVADSGGGFVVRLKDTGGGDVPLASGQTLSLTHRRATHVLPVSDLAAWPVDPGAALAGLTRPDTEVRAVFALAAGPGEPRSTTVVGRSDHLGVFTLPAPGVGRSSIRDLRVFARLPSGDEMHRAVDLVGSPGAVYLPLAHPGR